MRNPLKLSIEKVPKDCQDESLELKAESKRYVLWELNHRTVVPLDVRTPAQKWQKEQSVHYFHLWSYLGESGFSTLLQIKTKQGTVQGHFQLLMYTTFRGITLRSCLVYLHTWTSNFSILAYIYILYTCLSTKIISQFESNNIKFLKSLYVETGKLDGSNRWVYKAGSWSYTLTT